MWSGPGCAHAHTVLPSIPHPTVPEVGVGLLDIQDPLPHYRLCAATSVSGLLNNGDLVLKDISREDDGLYQCTVANHVGYSVCVVEMKVSGRCSGLGGPVSGLEESGLSFGAPAGSSCPMHRV